MIRRERVNLHSWFASFHFVKRRLSDKVFRMFPNFVDTSQNCKNFLWFTLNYESNMYSRISKASPSEFLENHEHIFIWYYMSWDRCSRLTSSTTLVVSHYSVSKTIVIESLQNPYDLVEERHSNRTEYCLSRIYWISCHVMKRYNQCEMSERGGDADGDHTNTNNMQRH